MSSAIPAIQTGQINNELNTSTKAWYSYNVSGYTSVVIHVNAAPGTTWAAGVQIDVEISLDGSNWSAFSTPQTYTANGVQAKLDIQDVKYMRTRISTSGSAGQIRVIVYGDTNA
jgi:hypothetical protein